MANADEFPKDQNETKGELDSNIKEATEDVKAYSITVEILPLIKDAQQHHGLRHKDYQRYRQYCARRLKRIRNTLNFKLGNRHGYKGKKISEDLVTDPRYLQMMLMNAERSWSYAMELKHYANQEPRKKFHMVRKLNKASFYSSELNKLCELDHVDARTKLEAQAYNYWMTANLKFEIQDWQSAVDLYTQARTIYEKLSTAFVDASVKTVYLQKVDDIGPNIRYCSYNLGQVGIDINELMKMRHSAAGQDQLAAKIDAAIKETREKLASSFGEVTWRGQTIPIKTEKARIVIQRVQSRKEELMRESGEEEKLEVYDNMLMECRDVLLTLKEEITAEMKSETNRYNLQFICTYVSYLRQIVLVERSQQMIENMKERLPILIGQENQKSKGKATKPEDLIRLYDSIIQSLTEVLQLPDLSEDEKITNMISVQITAYKAFRCFYIGQSYQQSKKWKESVSLYDRVQMYTQASSNQLLDFSELKNLQEKIDGLSRLAQGHKFAAHAASILEASELEAGTEKLDVSSTVLAERLDTYHEYKPLPKRLNFIQFPPEMKPIPMKPLFFDLALNHVTLPDISKRVEKKKESGISSMVAGWLWGSK